MENKSLIVSLIRDDLINSSLVNGLNKLGLNADQFTLHLSSTIFELLGLEKNTAVTENLLNSYLDMTRKVGGVNEPLKQYELDTLSNEIYEALLNAKRTFY